MIEDLDTVKLDELFATEPNLAFEENQVDDHDHDSGGDHDHAHQPEQPA